MTRLPTIWLAKFLRVAVRLTGRNSGSALPGLVVEKISPDFLEQMCGRLPLGVVVVTGTNGKTTTTRLLTHLLSGQGLRVLSNPSGSNLTRGVVSTIIEHSTLAGRLEYDVAVFELDEAFSPHFTKIARPKLLIALNVHRDQLDRYGEIDSAASLIARAASHASKVLVNGEDDLLVEQIKHTRPESKILEFTMSTELRATLVTEDTFNIAKKQVHRMVMTSFAQLTGSTKKQQGRQVFDGVVGGDHVHVTLPLLGVHNAFNALAALAGLKIVLPKVNLADASAVLADFKPAFGRGESLTVKGHKVTVALIKNPSGFMQNLRTFVDPTVDKILIIINDRYADGRDVSWLWDTDVSNLRNFKGEIYLAGRRRYDIALRLKYEGITHHVIETSDAAEGLRTLVDTKGEAHLLIMPTYTAMLSARKWLADQKGVRDLW
ncbi:MAG TPA: MurT ligase domain-containing protein [Candidatus Saccharimonadales bacterium]|nr:MurT ligase domain-containing protein [Candidatus Saccharimonadales bacterium]